MQIKNKDKAYNYGRAIGERMKEKYPPRMILRDVWELTKLLYKIAFLGVLWFLLFLSFPILLERLEDCRVVGIAAGHPLPEIFDYSFPIIVTVLFIGIFSLWCKWFIRGAEWFTRKAKEK